MKLSSRVVTTSSTPSRVFSRTGPSSSAAPASIAASAESGRTQGLPSAPVPSTTAMIAPA